MVGRKGSDKHHRRLGSIQKKMICFVSIKQWRGQYCTHLKLEISNLICFGKIQCTCIEILREHGVEKQYLQLPVHNIMLILKKIPAQIQKFLHQ